MKKKTVLLTLVLTLSLVIGTAQAAFAAIDPSVFNPFRTKVETEGDAETVAMNLYREAKKGGYGLVDTAELKASIDKGEAMLLIDTMPGPWYTSRHIKGAVNAECDMPSAGVYPARSVVTADQAKNLMKVVKDYSGTKKVTKYWNTKTKKWVTKKPAKKNWGKCTKKKDKHFKKKQFTETQPVKNKKIVVYCGFTKCRRSDAAADFLVNQGYTKVYRYPGGATAWYDSFEDALFEGTDISGAEG